MKRREMLRLVCGAVLGAAGGPLRWAAAGPRQQKVLYYTASAGFLHSVVRRQDGQLSHSEKVLTEMGKRAGFEVHATQDGRVFDGDLDAYDAIAFYTSGDLTRPNKNGTPPMTPAGKQKLLAAIAAGKGFVGFHSATDTFHSPGRRHEIQTQLDPYIAMIGGELVAHGPQQESSLFLVSRFPGAGDLGMAEGLSFYEEWYAMKNYAKDLHVIFVQETEGMKGDCYQRPDFPATWARRHGKGRVFYTSLGHREDIWTNPFFQAIALGGLAWAMGNVQYDIKPNIDRVTPHANRLSRGP
ncbi:MAG: ThuA domain-containing protein [Thermoguttaceae bacterium]